MSTAGSKNFVLSPNLNNMGYICKNYEMKMADSSQLIHSLILHKGHHTWNLHIRDVQRTDAGAYMCQINTAKAKTRMGHLTVVGK